MLSFPKLKIYNDLSHLGEIIGDPEASRIIALSTSSVFNDNHLIPKFWGIENFDLDSGYQAHLYSRPQDVLVFQVHTITQQAIQKIQNAVRANYNIWKSMTGTQLATPASQFVLATHNPIPADLHLPDNITLENGSLLQIASSLYKYSQCSFLAFVFNFEQYKMLEIIGENNSPIRAKALQTSMLMDKNLTMQLLENNGVSCAKTYSFDNNFQFDDLKTLPDNEKYVFKPAGGAAGIGVFGNGRGAGLEEIKNHIKGLKQKELLPRRFQIQEFISGKIFGASAYFDGTGRFNVFEVHEQNINEGGKFLGGRWLANKTRFKETAFKLFSQLAQIHTFSLSGLINIDFIGDKIIEVNPRITAAAPIAHVLKQKHNFEQYLKGFEIKQIDISTNVNIPYQAIVDGTLQKLIHWFWKQQKILILPQGLNPFGLSRVLFINDTREGTAQESFIHKITSTQ